MRMSVASGPVMGRRGFLGAAGAASLALLAGCSSGERDEQVGQVSDDGDQGGEKDDELAADDPYAAGTHHVSLEVDGFGTMELELYADTAPVTVSNFCHLVDEGFYDGLTFHRVVPDFVIQGGDPAGDGTGGSGRTIRGEFAANGVRNDIRHVRGTVSMARSASYDSASSQFFVVLEDAPSLNGQYAAFGTVTSGMEVADAIARDTPVADQGTGLVAPEDQPVIARVAVLD